MQLSRIPQIKHTTKDNFFLLSGPCAIEGEDMALRIAEKVTKITNDLK
ncbi:MAG: 3-deoxy-8-phosphooctulonate synthase, partial [Bacteroidota bacterium]